MENKSLATRISEWLDDFAKKVLSLANDLYATYEEENFLKWGEEAKKLRDLWWDAMKVASGRNKALLAAEVDFSELDDGRGVRDQMDSSDPYDFSKTFAEQIKDYEQGIFPQYDTFIVCKTPEVLKKIGMNDIPITLTQTHLDHLLRSKDDDHTFSRAQIENIPKYLENPIAIIESNSTHAKRNSIVVILDMTHNGKQAIGAIVIDGLGTMHNHEIDSNALTTVHTRKNTITRLLADAVNSEISGNGGIFYWQKNKAMQLLKARGVQFPTSIGTTDGFVRSIHDSLSKVNRKYKNVTETKQFRNWFGDYRSSENGPVVIADIPKYIATNEFRKANRGDVINNDTKWNISISRTGETNTISHSGKQGLSEYGLSGIRNLVENAILLDSEVHEHHSNDPKNDLIAFDHKLYALGESDIGIALYKITVEEYYQDYKHTNEKVFHNLKYIEKVADVGGRTAGQSLHDVSTNDIIATEYTVSNLYSLVKTYDKDFHAGKPVDPVLLDKNGEPKKFYLFLQNCIFSGF